MMKISTHKLKQLTPRDLREIAQLTLVARQASALREGDEALKGMDLTVKGIEKYLEERQTSPTPFGVVLACSNNKLIGWLMLSLKPDIPTQLSSYHPIISPDKISKDTATKIIKEGLNYAKNEGAQKIQVFLEIAEHLEQMYKTYGTWYETEGLKPRGESHYMLLSLSEYEFESIELSKGFVVKPILDEDKEELYLCYTETFKASLDRWNLDLTEEERQKQFNKSVSPSSSSLNKEASLALLHNNRIVGFSIVKNLSPEMSYLLDFGIHPDFRRRKLGKILLQLSIDKLMEQGLKTMSLHTDGQNYPALVLYQRAGFKTSVKTMRFELRANNIP